MLIGADFSVYVGEGNRSEKEVMDRFGIQGRNAEG